MPICFIEVVKLINFLKIWEENLVKILKQFLKSQQINNKSYGTNPTASNAEYKSVFQWTISDRLFNINLFYEIMIKLNVRHFNLFNVQKNLSGGGARSYSDEKA